MKYLRIAGFSSVVILLSLVLSACGGEDAFNGGCNPADTPTNITSFFVGGSTTDMGTEVINESGDFTVSWDLTTSCTYTYEVFLATSGTQQAGVDVPIASGTCGFGYSCSTSVDITCSFDAANKTMTCDSGASEDVSSILVGMSPMQLDRYLILEAHNEMMDSDVMASNQVRVDF